MPVIGHEKQKEYLRQAFQEKKIFPTFLFHGPSGIGKKQVALDFIQYVFCETHSNCGHCGACTRVLKQEHENLHILKTDKKNIKIEDVRDLLQTLHLQTQGDYRFVIIDEAEKLNPQAANALLKTLEEPPERTYFILVTSNKNSLLPTIRSRSAALHFSPLSLEELRSLHSDAPSWLYQTCEGRPGLFLSLQETEALDDRKIALELLKLNFQTIRYEAFSKIKENIGKAGQWDRVFFFMLAFIRDAEVIHVAKEKITNSDQVALLESVSKLGETQVLRYFEDVKKLQEQFFANQDKTLCLENFWLNWHEKHASISS